VHPITEDSPLYKYTQEDFEAIHGEIIVMITAFDDMFSNTVAIRTSYTFNELVYGAKFEPMFTRSTDNSKTILNLDLLNVYKRVSLP
jgi:inward rectifier potassium channel